MTVRWKRRDRREKLHVLHVDSDAKLLNHTLRFALSSILLPFVLLPAAGVQVSVADVDVALSVHCLSHQTLAVHVFVAVHCTV